MLKVAICDDDKIVVEEIYKTLEYKMTSLEEGLHIEKFTSGIALFSELEKNKYYDLIYLDIEMPELTGIELSQKLRDNLNNKKTQIAYISAKNEYIGEMINHAPLRFIQKNKTENELISKEKICEVIDYLIELKNQTEDYYTYTQDGNHYRINIKEIIYFSAEKRKIVIHGKYSEKTFYHPFKKLEKEIQENPKMKDFIKINRGLIVNTNYCEKLINNELYLNDGSTLPVSIIAKKKIVDFIFRRHKI